MDVDFYSKYQYRAFNGDSADEKKNTCIRDYLLDKETYFQDLVVHNKYGACREFCDKNENHKYFFGDNGKGKCTTACVERNGFRYFKKLINECSSLCENRYIYKNGVK
jgi:hypothetical protein